MLLRIYVKKSGTLIECLLYVMYKKDNEQREINLLFQALKHYDEMGIIVFL
jgi:hypothetical protein